MGSNPIPATNGPLVKRLRHRPFTAVTGVRFSHGSPKNNTHHLVCVIFLRDTRVFACDEDSFALPLTRKLDSLRECYRQNKRTPKGVLLFWRRHPDLNRGIEVLQTFALPLGHVALFLSGSPDYIIIFPFENTGYKKSGEFSRPFFWSGLRGSNPPPSPWQGDALPNELNPQAEIDVSADGASGRNRTNDTRIFSPLLYQLSYRGIQQGLHFLKWRPEGDSNP